MLAHALIAIAAAAAITAAVMRLFMVLLSVEDLVLRRQERGRRSAREAPFLESACSRPSAGDLASPSGLHRYGITVAGQLRFGHRIRCGRSPATVPQVRWARTVRPGPIL
ncbi:hypothetical protein GCM10022251_61100 [Phytohabitans flavus]|uniref:Uncharacterized protein n=1 Tax=Phytohabitans flavus TaxID=1076124 RepID=A0A6F8Y4T9_9ACTN|nr:hypothetical protein Pflav_074080 [Phytohabitans flavus]